jgi:hypothetical protein
MSDEIIDDKPVAIPPNPYPGDDLGETPEDPETVLATMEKERRSRQEAEKRVRLLTRQLAAFKGLEGVDPEKYRQAIANADRYEELERQQAELRANIEAEFQQKYEPQLRKQQAIAAEQEQKLLNLQRDTVLEKEFYAAGGFPGEFEPAALALRGRVQVKDGQVIVLEPDGKTPAYVADRGQSRPKEVAELIEELKSTTWFARHFKGSDKPGFGPLGTPGGVTANPDASRDEIWGAVDREREKRFGR